MGESAGTNCKLARKSRRKQEFKKGGSVLVCFFDDFSDRSPPGGIVDVKWCVMCMWALVAKLGIYFLSLFFSFGVLVWNLLSCPSSKLPLLGRTMVSQASMDFGGDGRFLRAVGFCIDCCQVGKYLFNFNLIIKILFPPKLVGEPHYTWK